jgi:hypothetical protein
MEGLSVLCALRVKNTSVARFDVPGGFAAQGTALVRLDGLWR